MNILKDAIGVNKLSLKNSLKNLKFVPLLAFVIVFFNIIQINLNMMVFSSPIGNNIIGRMLLYIIEMMLLSATMSMIYSIIMYNRVTVETITNGFTRYVGPLMNTFFYLYLARLVVELTGLEIMLGYFGSLAIAFAFFVIESPLIEEVYLDGQSGIPAISYAFKFIKQNILPWLIVMIAFSYIKYHLSIWVFVSIMHTQVVVRILVYSFLLAFIYLYKGHLFVILNNSSVRKRQFQGLFRG